MPLMGAKPFPLPVYFEAAKAEFATSSGNYTAGFNDKKC